MKQLEISINPFAEYWTATEARRKRIIKEQLDPDPIRIPYYQLARARIRKSLAESGSLDVINESIKELMERKPIKKWKKSDQINSISALDNFKSMLLPSKIVNYELELIKSKQKHISLYGVSIKMSPNIMFRVMIDGKPHVGAAKIHISKGKPFSNKQSKLVATLLYQFMSEWVAEEADYVDPDLCFCIDPFAGTTINSDSKITVDMRNVKMICHELPTVWDDVIKEEEAA